MTDARRLTLIRATCLAMFFAFLAAPTVQERLGLIEFEALEENRNREKRPEGWTNLFTEGPRWTSRYEKYFNDTFGFRDQFIRIKHQLDYWLFRESDTVVVGRDGWLSHKSIIEPQYAVESMGDAEHELILDRLRALRSILAERGITLVLLTCPIADTIYPEMFPADVLVPQPRWKRFKELAGAGEGAHLIDAEPILMDLKGKIQIFHKMDFHWTDPAAAHVGKHLVDTLGKLAGVGPLWDQPIQSVTREIEGGELMFMGLLFPPREQAVFLDESKVTPGSGETVGVDANTWTFTSDLPADARLIPPTVLFGDSFADAFDRAGWRKYFRRLQKFYNHELSSRYAEIPEGTRFVILQVIDGFVTVFSNHGYWPPDVVNRARMLAPRVSTKVTASLVADPNPVPICPKSGLGTTTVSWVVDGTNDVELRVGNLDGPIVATGGTGSATISWAGQGTVFFLKDRTRPAATNPESAMARLEIQTTSGSCGE